MITEIDQSSGPNTKTAAVKQLSMAAASPSRDRRRCPARNLIAAETPRVPMTTAR